MPPRSPLLPMPSGLLMRRSTQIVRVVEQGETACTVRTTPYDVYAVLAAPHAGGPWPLPPGVPHHPTRASIASVQSLYRPITHARATASAPLITQSPVLPCNTQVGNGLSSGGGGLGGSIAGAGSLTRIASVPAAGADVKMPASLVGDAPGALGQNNTELIRLLSEEVSRLRAAVTLKKATQATAGAAAGGTLPAAPAAP